MLAPELVERMQQDHPLHVPDAFSAEFFVLLAADMGHWIKLEDGRSAKIVKIEFKTGSDVNL